ncbi:uncharacterized protein Rv2082-like [Helianthus annuus]|uniref:uncharacterized protein Rv2082-like n=1 Tax=Helianthus annuus TaxID=4232 RepID=UPI0016533EA6|nr:uncharacterized protein Rv2082-like [Helianthus annuus]
MIFGPFVPPSSGLFAPLSSGPFGPAPSSRPSAPLSSSGPFAPVPSSGPSALYAPAPSSGPFASAPSSGLSAPAPSFRPPAPSSVLSAPAPSSVPYAPAPSPAPSPSSGPSTPEPAPAPAPAPAPSSEPSAPVSDPTETQPPILPLPTQTGNHSKVLLLDEITVDLDVLARADLLTFLKKECEELGATIIYATHIFDGLENWPSHIVYVAHGKLQLASTMEEVKKMSNLSLMVSFTWFTHQLGYKINYDRQSNNEDVSDDARTLNKFEIQNRQTHHNLRADLVKHIWMVPRYNPDDDDDN